MFVAGDSDCEAVYVQSRQGWLVRSLKNQRRVASSKPEGVGHRVSHGQRPSRTRDEVQTIVDIGTFEIDSRRRDLVPQRKSGKAGFETPRASEEMAGHGFRRADSHSARVIIKNFANGCCFRTVSERSRERNRCGDETSARGTGRKVSARSDRLLSLPAAQAASFGTASRLGCKSWQDIVNEKESPRERRSVQRNRSIRAGRK